MYVHKQTTLVPIFDSSAHCIRRTACRRPGGTICDAPLVHLASCGLPNASSRLRLHQEDLCTVGGCSKPPTGQKGEETHSNEGGERCQHAIVWCLPRHTHGYWAEEQVDWLQKQEKVNITGCVFAYTAEARMPLARSRQSASGTERGGFLLVGWPTDSPPSHLRRPSSRHVLREMQAHPCKMGG